MKFEKEGLGLPFVLSVIIFIEFFPRLFQGIFLVVVTRTSYSDYPESFLIDFPTINPRIFPRIPTRSCPGILSVCFRISRTVASKVLTEILHKYFLLLFKKMSKKNIGRNSSKTSVQCPLVIQLNTLLDWRNSERNKRLS